MAPLRPTRHLARIPRSAARVGTRPTRADRSMPARSANTMCAPAAASRERLPVRSPPTTRPKPPCRAAPPATASSATRHSAGGTPSRCAASTYSRWVCLSGQLKPLGVVAVDDEQLSCAGGLQGPTRYSGWPSPRQSEARHDRGGATDPRSTERPARRRASATGQSDPACGPGIVSAPDREPALIEGIGERTFDVSA